MRKIIEEHGIYPSQVRAAVVRVSGLDFSWVYEPGRGSYVIVRVEIEDEDALVVLYPTENPADHEWRLGSAYFIHG